MFGNIANLIIPERKYPTNNLLQEPAVYLLVIKSTGQKYIGSTCDMNRRKSEYDNPNSCDYNKRVLKGLTPNDIEITVLEYCGFIPENERLIKELNYILQFDTFQPNGLNKISPVKLSELKNINIDLYNSITNKNKKPIKRKKRKQAKRRISSKQVLKPITGDFVQVFPKLK